LPSWYFVCLLSDEVNQVNYFWMNMPRNDATEYSDSECPHDI